MRYLTAASMPDLVADHPLARINVLYLFFFRFWSSFRRMGSWNDVDFELLARRAGRQAAIRAVELGYLEQPTGWSAVQQSLGFPAISMPASGTLRFIDLFAGIGGLRIAFEAAGGACVFTSEIDPFSRRTYAENFRKDGHEIAGDIRAVSVDSIPEHDVLLAGFPCQPFSIAGVTKKNALHRPHGFDCPTQGTLFFDIKRILEVHRPRAFLLENVKNLVSHDRGETFRIIRKVLADDLGYHLHWRVIDARGWTPQHRERIFIVGFRDANDFSFDDLPLRSASSGPRLDAILHPEDGSEIAELPYTIGPQARVADRYGVTPHMWGYLQAYAEKHRQLGNGFGFGLCGPEDVARTLSARYYKDGSEILIRRDPDQTPRRLTPRECARLMGFDRPGQTPFRIPVSDSQAWRQFGNSVVVPVVEVIARGMVAALSANGVAESKLTARWSGAPMASDPRSHLVLEAE